MQTSSQPKLLPIPFADNGDRKSIPNDSQIGITAGRASYNDGFPPLTRTPLAAGGVPPFGTDFNGVLNDITAALRWSQSGAGYPFNAAFNTAISGYPKGARIPNSTLDGYWLNTTDGNTANPEVTGAATTGWVPAENYGVTAITGLSGSSVTLTTLQASKERITLAGTLSTNINMVLPAWIKRWTIVNNCTGAFSVTVKTPTGTGVAVPNGRSAILQGDGTNIIPGEAPGALLNIADFTASGTYTPTPGTRFIIVEVTGGGGGGGASNTTGATSVSVGAGGGAGGTAISKLNISDIATPVSVMVGNGGAAANSSTIATSGGQSSFGSYLFATGGDFGVSGTTITQGDTAMVYNGGGGQGVNGNLDNMIGGSGGFGIILKFGYESGWGGRSYYSSGGNPIVTLGTPNPGFAGRKGSGGSGGFGANNSPVQNGGAGGSGFVRIWEYA